MSIRWTIPLLCPLLLAAVVACGNEVEPSQPSIATIPSDSFQAVIIELATSRIEALPDTQAWIERRREVLDRHGVSAEDLQAFVEAYGGHDEVMEPIYRKLGATLDSIEATRSPGEGADRFPSAEEAARSAARAGEAIDSARVGALVPDTLRAGEAVPGTAPEEAPGP